MQHHTKVYVNYFGYGEQDFIPCEICKIKATEIHHIIYRSKFGSKRKDEQDNISNLIALCRTHHDQAHANIIPAYEIQRKHDAFLKLHER